MRARTPDGKYAAREGFEREVAELYGELGSVDRVAAQVGLGRQQVKRYLRRAGALTPKPRRKITDEGEARIEVLMREGLPDTWIAEEVGLSACAINARRQKLRIPCGDWLAVQLSVRGQPALAPLHAEFAPPSSR